MLIGEVLIHVQDIQVYSGCISFKEVRYKISGEVLFKVRGDILFFLKWSSSSYVRDLILGEEVDLCRFRESFCNSRKLSDMREIGKLMGRGDILSWVRGQMSWSGSVEEMERRKVRDIVSWLRRSDLAGVFETGTWDRYMQEYHMIQACF